MVVQNAAEEVASFGGFSGVGEESGFTALLVDIIFIYIGLRAAFLLGRVVWGGFEEGEGTEAGFEGGHVEVGPVGCAEEGGDGRIRGAEEVEEEEEGDGGERIAEGGEGGVGGFFPFSSEGSVGKCQRRILV